MTHCSKPPRPPGDLGLVCAHMVLGGSKTLVAGPSWVCLEMTSLLAPHMDWCRDHVSLAPVKPRGFGDP